MKDDKKPPKLTDGLLICGTLLLLSFPGCKNPGSNDGPTSPTPPPPASGCGSVVDQMSHPPGTAAIPAKGQEFVDPVFGCRIRRLSDAKAEGWAHVEHFYSSVNAFNSDSSKLITVSRDGVIHVRDLQGNIIRNNLNDFGILPQSDVSWSRTNPNVLYFHEINRNRLMSYDVATNSATVIYTFSNYGQVAFGLGEGDISWDGNHLAVLGDHRWGFLFNLSSKTSTKAVDLLAYSGGVDINWVDVTPDNMFIAMINPSGAKNGVSLWNEQMNFKRRITEFPMHADRTQDRDGNDLLVLTNSADANPDPGCPNGQISIDLESGTEKCLAPLDWSLATHTSCNNVGQGWCITSTYSNNTTQGNWPSYTNEIFKINLDGSLPIRLAHSRSSNQTYETTPRASVSPDGRYVLFTSDMDGVSDVYLIIIP